jgi:serine/threonine protein phosphatase PrpC
LLCANVGDSRAILGKNKNGSWSAVPLSEDHKPSLEKEA